MIRSLNNQNKKDHNDHNNYINQRSKNEISDNDLIYNKK